MFLSYYYAMLLLRGSFPKEFQPSEGIARLGVEKNRVEFFIFGVLRVTERVSSFWKQVPPTRGDFLWRPGFCQVTT